jgi:prepilin-type N-terminal cleavage/methylation domain-containing protein
MKKKNFTLVELIVVVAIVAVIGSGIAVTYTGLQEDAKAKMTLYEMKEIKDAFTRFYDDNYLELNKPIVNHAGGIESDKMAYFETYGLWPLLKHKIEITGNPDMEFSKYDPLKGYGWNGPYVENIKLYEGKTITQGVYNFPQINDKYSDYYRIVKLEHAVGAKTYKRLLLVCTQDGTLDIENGNYDGGGTNRIDFNTGAIKLTDSANDDIVVELLNEDY